MHSGKIDNKFLSIPFGGSHFNMKDGIYSGKVICDTEFSKVIIPDVTNGSKKLKDFYGDLVAGMKVYRNS